MRALLTRIPLAGLLASLPAQQVTLRSIAGEQIAGARVAVADDHVSVTRADGSTVDLSLDEVESVSCDGQRPLASKGPGRVWLRSGAEFGAELVGAEGGSARLDVGFGAPVSIGLVQRANHPASPAITRFARLRSSQALRFCAGLRSR